MSQRLLVSSLGFAFREWRKAVTNETVTRERQARAAAAKAEAEKQAELEQAHSGLMLCKQILYALDQGCGPQTLTSINPKTLKPL